MAITYPNEHEPIWLPLFAMLAIGGLYAALPSTLLAGAPRWVPVVIVVTMLVPMVILHYVGNHALHQTQGYVLNSIVTAALILSLA